jgi:PAS domain S-box-containing protein
LAPSLRALPPALCDAMKSSAVQAPVAVLDPKRPAAGPRSSPTADAADPRSNLARLRDFAEISTDVLWETDADFRFVSVFGAPEHVIGLKAEDMVGKTRWEIARADLDAPKWRQHIEDHLAGRPYHDFEFSYRDGGTQIRWVAESGRPFFSESGTLLGYRGKSTDVTPLREAEAKLGRSARQQQAVAMISQLALRATPAAELYEIAASSIAKALLVDNVSIFELSADKQVLRLRGGYGWPPNTVHLRAIPLAVCRPLHEALRSSEAVTFARGALKVVPGAGTEAGSGIAVAIGDDADRVGVLSICSRDERDFDAGDVNFLRSIAFVLAAVVEQRKAEAVLRLRDRALEALDQGILITDAGRFDHPLIYVNPSFERLTGYAEGEVIGKNPRFLHGADTDAEVVNTIRAAVENERTFRGSVLNYRKDGSSFWNDLTISPVRDERGTTTHFVGILSDVTERIQLEAQLRQAQKMEAVGHLTGGIAHDFNNLLAVILGNSEILAEAIVDPELKSTAELVMETAERGADLTQRLLAFGRRQALRPEAIPVDDAIASFSGVLRRTLGEHVSLVTPEPGGSDAAMVDRGLFESAILNLAVNARDAMPDGGLLTIATRTVASPGRGVPEELAPGEYVTVSVRDTGCGMSEDVLARVFEPFFTTKGVGKGSGLGLAMVYGFAKQSGGHVSIESAPGKGTTVHLFLKKASSGQAMVEKADEEERPMPAGCENILLVEDESEVRRFVSKQMSRLGYSVLEAENGAAALDVLASDREIHLLFSDLILPGGISGLQLLERARQIRPGLRAVLTTGYTEEFDRFEKCVTDPILKKPYKRAALADTLRRALDARPN